MRIVTHFWGMHICFSVTSYSFVFYDVPVVSLLMYCLSWWIWRNSDWSERGGREEQESGCGFRTDPFSAAFPRCWAHWTCCLSHGKLWLECGVAVDCSQCWQDQVSVILPSYSFWTPVVETHIKIPLEAGNVPPFHTDVGDVRNLWYLSLLLPQNRIGPCCLWVPCLESSGSHFPEHLELSYPLGSGWLQANLVKIMV